MVGKTLFLALVGLVGVAYGSSKNACYETLQCNNAGMFSSEYDPTKCTAEWGAFPRVNGDTNELIALQLNSSLEYLLIASHFKNWKFNRPGFAEFFNKLSDDNWNEAIALLTHMVERGGTLVKDFQIHMPGPIDLERGSSKYELKEIEALSKALDTEKRIATKTLHLAHLANHGQGVPHDSEFAEFLAKRLHHNSVLRIKHLANNVKLLSDIVRDSVDYDYALFRFDSEYLK